MNWHNQYFKELAYRKGRKGGSYSVNLSLKDSYMEEIKIIERKIKKFQEEYIIIERKIKKFQEEYIKETDKQLRKRIDRQVEELNKQILKLKEKSK
jgi:archaellum component FlaC